MLIWWSWGRGISRLDWEVWHRWSCALLGCAGLIVIYARGVQFLYKLCDDTVNDLALFGQFLYT